MHTIPKSIYVLLFESIGVQCTLDLGIVSITTKPYLQKTLSQLICCNCLAWKHGIKKNQLPTTEKKAVS